MIAAAWLGPGLRRDDGGGEAGAASNLFGRQGRQGAKGVWRGRRLSARATLAATKACLSLRPKTKKSRGSGCPSSSRHVDVRSMTVAQAGRERR
ncbi:protein of unknown function [Hyphomicrobium sp. 1Nfss2.1]